MSRLSFRKSSNALLLPVGAVQSRNGKTVVLQRSSRKPGEVRYKTVQTGMQDESNIEILEGLSDSSVVLLPDTSFVLPGKKGGIKSLYAAAQQDTIMKPHA